MSKEKINEIDKYLSNRYGISYTDLNIALINKNNIIELQNVIIELSEEKEKLFNEYLKEKTELINRIYKAIELLKVHENDNEANYYAPIRETLDVLRGNSE